MADFRYRTDLDPRHYRFERSIRDYYPDERRETYEDKLADRVVLIVSVLVVILLLAGVLR